MKEKLIWRNSHSRQGLEFLLVLRLRPRAVNTRSQRFVCLALENEPLSAFVKLAQPLFLYDVVQELDPIDIGLAHGHKLHFHLSGALLALAIQGKRGTGDRFPRLGTVDDQVLEKSQGLHEVRLPRGICTVERSYGQGFVLVAGNRSQMVLMIGVTVARHHREGLFLAKRTEVGNREGEQHLEKESHK